MTEKNAPLERTESSSKKKSNSIRLMVVVIIIVISAMAFATFWKELNLEVKHIIYLEIGLIIGLLLNITGLIVGVFERKNNPRMATMGIIGNTILLLFFTLLTCIVFS